MAELEVLLSTSVVETGDTSSLQFLNVFALPESFRLAAKFNGWEDVADVCWGQTDGLQRQCMPRAARCAHQELQVQLGWHGRRRQSQGNLVIAGRVVDRDLHSLVDQHAVSIQRLAMQSEAVTREVRGRAKGVGLPLAGGCQ